ALATGTPAGEYMASLPGNEQPAWYLSRRFQVGAIIVLAAFALGEGVVAIFLRDNDFAWHRAFGQEFLQREPYKNRVAQYLTARAMINALAAWLPYRVDRAVVYLAALASLAWTVLAWHRLANRQRPLR